jgi:cephalosporin hydroxylase
MDISAWKKGGEAFAEFLLEQKYDDQQKAEFHKRIVDFNELYYAMHQQTWGITSWRGVRVLKPPTDMWVYQELIQQIQPRLIIETGTMFGGSALFMADVLDKVRPFGKVLSIDISHERLNEKAQSAYPEFLEFYRGNSVDSMTVDYVKDVVKRYDGPVMVVLDSCHEKDHVLKEIELYGPFVTPGSMLIIEDGNNHEGVRGALEEFALQVSNQKPAQWFKNVMGEKYMLTFNRDGYWERLDKDGKEAS